MTFEAYIEEGYTWGAPSQEAEQIDGQIAEGMTCQKCGHGMTYDGRHRDTPWGYEYVAAAECPKCGYRVEF